MNILFTTFCNRQCPYCFAKSKLQNEATTQGESLSLKDLAYALDFLKKSGDPSVQVLGGEPTLHPRFKEAFSMVLKKKFPTVSLFTNGLMPEPITAYLKKLDPSSWGMVLNVNAPAEYTKKQWGIVNATAKAFGTRVTLSYNIYQLNPDMGFLVEFMEKNNTGREIRIGLALPIFGGSNTHVAVKDYPKIAKTLVAFAEKNHEKGVSMQFDCGFTLCSFTDTQLGKLCRFGTKLNFGCGIPLDLGPGLRLWKCFPTSGIWNTKLTDFKDINDIRSFYLRKTSQLVQVGAGGPCIQCSHHKLGRCAGGCLGHTLRAMKLEGRIERMK